MAPPRPLPDAVLLDLGPPDMDDTEVIVGLRGWTTIPILVLSGCTGQTDKVTALDAGADDYITKPFSMEEREADGGCGVPGREGGTVGAVTDILGRRTGSGQPDAVASQNLEDSRCGDPVAQAPPLALDPGIAPRRIIAGQPEYQNDEYPPRSPGTDNAALAWDTKTSW